MISNPQKTELLDVMFASFDLMILRWLLNLRVTMLCTVDFVTKANTYCKGNMIQ